MIANHYVLRTAIDTLMHIASESCKASNSRHDLVENLNSLFNHHLFPDVPYDIEECGSVNDEPMIYPLSQEMLHSIAEQFDHGAKCGTLLHALDPSSVSEVELFLVEKFSQHARHAADHGFAQDSSNKFRFRPDENEFGGRFEELN